MIKINFFKYLLILHVVFIQILNGQVLYEKKIYSNGLIPDVEIDKESNLHITWSNPVQGIKYIELDSSLNLLQDTLSITDSEGADNPSIDVSDSFVSIVWRSIRMDFKDYIKGTVFPYKKSNINDSILIFNDDLISDINRWKPKVCFINDTLLITVWYGYSTFQMDNMNIIGQFFNTKYQLLGNNFKINEHDNNNVNSINPLVKTLTEEDDFIVIWLENYTGKDEIFARIFKRNGTPKTNSFSITKNMNINKILYFSMDVDSIENFVVVWSAKIDSEWVLQCRWFDNEGLPITELITISRSDISDCVYYDVDISVDKKGQTIIVWEKKSKNKFSIIYGQRLSSEKEILGNSFKISENYREAYQVSPKVILYNDKIYTFWVEINNETNCWANIINFQNPPTKIEKNISNIKKELSFFLNYPNPFNNNTTIAFELNKNAYIVFDIFDINGRKIRNLINKKCGPGYYKIKWNGKNNLGIDVPSGVYWGKLKKDTENNFIKMLLIR